MINATLLSHDYQPLKGQSHDQCNFTYSQLSTIKGQSHDQCNFTYSQLSVIKRTVT